MPGSRVKSSFVDLQVNGYMGVDFSNPSLTPEAVSKVASLLKAKGTGAFLATVVTSPMDSYRKTLPAIVEAMRSGSSGAGILGIHLEGPFISPEDGAVGAHSKSAVQAPSLKAFDELQALCDGSLKLLTLAPELPGALALIRHAKASGVVVSAGHSLCSASDADAAFEAGASLSTHLGNGVPNMMHRHLNPVIAQLSSGLSPMLISDGHHLPASFIKVVFAAKGLANSVVVSDSAPVAGMPPGEYEILGTKARVCEDGSVRNLNAPTLAGSSATMLQCLNFLASSLSLDERALWALGRDNPLRALGLEPLAPRLPALVSFDASSSSFSLS